MRPSSRLRVLAVVFVCATLAACASLPVQEMSDARQAIAAARDAGAETRAPDILSVAVAYLEQAEQALRDGAYDRARESALAARWEASRARDRALEQQEPEAE